MNWGLEKMRASHLVRRNSIPRNIKVWGIVAYCLKLAHVHGDVSEPHSNQSRQRTSTIDMNQPNCLRRIKFESVTSSRIQRSGSCE